MMERDYWLGFSAFSGIGPMKFKKLLNKFGSAKDAWSAKQTLIEKVLGERLGAKFDEFRSKFSIADYVNKLKKKNVSFIILTDKEYPELLKKIRNPPFVLYVKGNIDILSSSSEERSDESRSINIDSSRLTTFARTINHPTIAVVGTRRTTSYGREVTKILTQDLVLAGFTIVSGLAMGIDAISHKTAIENGGKTIAVLGCGVDCCSPEENLALYNSIIQKGSCIISEYPLSQIPTKWSFPARNRIIAGLSMGVLVTEGAEDSGSLITADYARKFGRPVFAVPGPITSSMSKGPYKLIQKGARLVTKAEDILEELGVQEKSIKGGKSIKSIKGGSPEENLILEILQNEPFTFDELVRKTGFDSSKTGSILSLMEIKGLVKGLESGQFSIAS